MKVIQVPAALKIKPPQQPGADPKEIPFAEFVTLHLDSYSEVKTPKQVRQLSKVYDALEKAQATLTLEDAEYDLLKAAVEQVKYVPGVSRQLVPYFDAIDGAQEVKK